MGAIAKEVKEEILQKVKTGEKVQAVADQYGITIQTIYGWLKQKVSDVSKTEYNRLKKENQQLKELVGALTMEIEKHKKKKDSR